jgi:hypothetical protein
MNDSRKESQPDDPSRNRLAQSLDVGEGEAPGDGASPDAGRRAAERAAGVGEGRPKKQWSTLIRPALKERLNAASFWLDRSKAELLDEALRDKLAELERENGGPFEILPPHRED